MLDIKIIREKAEEVQSAIRARRSDLVIAPILDLDEKRRGLITHVETLKSERNTASKEIGKVKKEGGDAAEQMEAVRKIGDQISDIDKQLAEVEEGLNELLLSIPNVPHPDVPLGHTEEDNKFVRTFGEAKTFDFEAKPHWDLAKELGLLDPERAARMTKSGFSLLKGPGARLSRALTQYMLDLHTEKHGYMEVEPPFVVNSEAMTGTGQLPKMADDMYYIQNDELWLIPTAEVPVTNMHRDEIITETLPLSYVAFTPCFRREAGAAGKMTRGLNRVHQFNKVELVKFVEPESSYDELEKLLNYAEAVLQGLGLHYRVIELCTGELSFASAKTYDIELWAPGQEAWLEVSSCSNFEDFQARRAKIRYKNAAGKNEFVHTLNGSGVALPRLLVAVMENGQQEDGSILIPELLRPYMGGLECIKLN